MSVVNRLILACVHRIKSVPFIQRQPLTKKDDGCCSLHMVNMVNMVSW